MLVLVLNEDEAEQLKSIVRRSCEEGRGGGAVLKKIQKSEKDVMLAIRAVRFMMADVDWKEDLDGTAR